jgi:Response regulator containing a CheY-like receiver domain and an HTH DNA-binding domain
MPELNGIEATRQIHDASPSTQVLILSMHSTTEHIFRALQAGARGYLLKESAGTEVVDARFASCIWAGATSARRLHPPCSMITSPSAAARARSTT